MIEFLDAKTGQIRNEKESEKMMPADRRLKRGKKSRQNASH